MRPLERSQQTASPWHHFPSLGQQQAMHVVRPMLICGGKLLGNAFVAFPGNADICGPARVPSCATVTVFIKR